MRPLKWRAPTLARDTAASVAFRRLCAAAVLQMRANAAGAQAGSDPEYLHQMRVGARRLRSTLRAFRPLLNRARAKAFSRRLRAVMRRLGAARDWDVFCRTLRLHGAGDMLLLKGQRKARAAYRKARHAFGVLPSLPDDLLAADGSLPQLARRSLDKLQARLEKHADGIDWRRPRRRHAVRIAVKRLRYACDTFATCFTGEAARAYGRDLARLQDVLGELNDIAVGKRLLEKLGGDAPVRTRLETREAALIGELLLAWRAFHARPAFWRARGKTPRGRAR